MPLPRINLSVVIMASCSILAACAAGSSASGSGNEPGTQSTNGRSVCGDDTSQLDISVNSISRVASRVGITMQTAPKAALRLALAKGQNPYFGGSGGSGLVGEGYPAAGWAQTSRSGARATFQAPYNSGTAKITLTRVDGRWLVSHAEFGC